MKIIHRISLVDEAERRTALSALGIRFSTSNSPLVRILRFAIDESDPVWGQVRELLPNWNTEDGCNPASLGGVGTFFSKREHEAASYLLMMGGWDHGYPQPSDDFGYQKITYDPNLYCRCGIGKKQIAPFRMKCEPKWGTRHVLQMNWVFDEFFVRPAVYESVFKPFGIGCLPVVDHRTNKELGTVLQLAVKDVEESSLLGIPPDHPSETCVTCGKTKYHPIVRGFFPLLRTVPSGSMCKSREYFGSGGEARNAVVVSADLYRAICAQKVKGLAFVPLANRIQDLTLPLR